MQVPTERRIRMKANLCCVHCTDLRICRIDVEMNVNSIGNLSISHIFDTDTLCTPHIHYTLMKWQLSNIQRTIWKRIWNFSLELHVPSFERFESVKHSSWLLFSESLCIDYSMSSSCAWLKKFILHVLSKSNKKIYFHLSMCKLQKNPQKRTVNLWRAYLFVRLDLTAINLDEYRAESGI